MLGERLDLEFERLTIIEIIQIQFISMDLTCLYKPEDTIPITK